MELLLSPWFLGLSVLSLLITFLNLWGFRRAFRKHNASAMVLLCGKSAQQPNRRAFVVAILYIALTVIYILLPPLFHSLLFS